MAENKKTVLLTTEEKKVSWQDANFTHYHGGCVCTRFNGFVKGSNLQLNLIANACWLLGKRRSWVVKVLLTSTWDLPSTLV